MHYDSAAHEDHALPSGFAADRGEVSSAPETAAPKRKPSDALKRLMDLCICVPLAIVALPGLLALAYMIRRDDPGPSLFIQERRGRNGQLFRCWKFRTMIMDADKKLEEVLASDPLLRRQWEEKQKLENDPRVTRLGAFLRKSSLDELPQLYNIIRGEMSIVGPRPITPGEAERYGDKIGHYDEVRPGIVGLWQISGRSDTSYVKRVELDVTYSAERSFSKDVEILFRAIPAVLCRKGAY